MPVAETRKLEDGIIVVTGASGFVGGHVLDHLRVRFPDATILTAGRDAAATLHFDLDRPETAAAIAATGADAVVHLAGEASIAGAAATWRSTLIGTLALAEAIAAMPRPATLLLASSAEVYGQAFADGEVDEETPPVPATVYGSCKIAVERAAADVLGPRSTLIVARPSNHIGPGQRPHFALPSFARQIAEGERRGSETVIDVGNLDPMRDFLDVRDVAVAYGLLLARYHGSATRTLFNVSSGEVRPVGALLDMLIAAAAVPCRTRTAPSRVRPQEVPVARVSSRALRAATGWAPAIAIDATVADLLADARARAAESSAAR